MVTEDESPAADRRDSLRSSVCFRMSRQATSQEFASIGEEELSNREGTRGRLRFEAGDRKNTARGQLSDEESEHRSVVHPMSGHLRISARSTMPEVRRTNI
jgi:hypothetical protein